MTPISHRLERFRVQAGGHAIHGLLAGLSGLGRLHPKSRPGHHGVELIRDVPYLATGRRAHLLDVYRPVDAVTPAPAVLYVHGGGFRILSKETHWMMGLGFAMRGYVVFSINYHLAPKHPYPAALEDVSAAYCWVVENAAHFGADPERLVLAGESAGGNLVTSLAIETAWPRPEPWAQPVWETGVMPRAVVPKCGMLQVTGTERFLEKKKLSTFLADRIVEVGRGYVGPGRDGEPGGLDLADPLVWLERADPPARPLPPFFVTVGTADPILDDSRRLKPAVERHGARCGLEIYPGEPHAFQAFVMRREARRSWRATWEFLDDVLGDGAPRRKLFGGRPAQRTVG